jgi:membrane protease subunit HflC
MKRIVFGVIGILVVLWVLLPQVLFIIDEREQVIITQFGAYVRTIARPGLHAKVPFVQTVYRFERRV